MIEKENEIVLQPLTREYFEPWPGFSQDQGQTDASCCAKGRESEGREMAKVLDASALMVYYLEKKEEGYRKVKRAFDQGRGNGQEAFDGSGQFP